MSGRSADTLVNVHCGVSLYSNQSIVFDLDFVVSPSPLTALTLSVSSLSSTHPFFFLSTLDGLVEECSQSCRLLRGSDLCLVGLWLPALNQSRVICLFLRVALALSVALLLFMVDWAFLLATFFTSVLCDVSKIVLESASGSEWASATRSPEEGHWSWAWPLPGWVAVVFPPSHSPFPASCSR